MILDFILFWAVWITFCYLVTIKLVPFVMNKALEEAKCVNKKDNE